MGAPPADTEITPRIIALEDTSLTLREATPDDAAAILRMLEYIGGETDFLTFGAGEFDMSEEDERAYLAAQRDSPTGLYLVACREDGEVVGSLSFSTPARRRMRHAGTFGVSVARAYWGHGVGTALMEMLISWARANPIVRKINLEVRTDNTRAIALYLKLGFVVEGTLRRAVFEGGRYFDDYAMGLWLGGEEDASSL